MEELLNRWEGLQWILLIFAYAGVVYCINWIKKFEDKIKKQK